VIAASSIAPFMGDLIGSTALGVFDPARALNADFGAHRNERSSIVNPVALVLRIAPAEMEINRDGPPRVDKFIIARRIADA
jgi:hypothetical protein